MASEFCLSVTKYFLFLFNLICFILGLSLLGLGLWIMCSKERMLIPGHPYLPLSVFTYLLVISGSVTMVLSFFGCLGALKGVKCMLAFYFILLTGFLAVHIIGTVLLFTQRSAFESSLDDKVPELIKTSEGKDSSLQDFRIYFEFLQSQVRCCGWKGKTDWTEVPCSCYNNTVNATVESFNISKPCPCKLNSENSENCYPYEQSCKEIVKKWFDEHLMIILGVILAIAAVKICGIILSMCQYSRVSMDFNVPFSSY